MSLRERLSSVLALLQRNAAFRAVINAFNAEFETFNTDTQSVKDSLFVDTAAGQSLDLIAEELSIIARRRGRDDEQYRQFLQGLVPAFGGRGTERDVRVAVAAGVSFDRTEVDLRQDFQNREYEVELFDWIAHSTTTTRTLADLADPVAVDRIDPVYLFSDAGAVRLTGGATVTETITRQGLSSGNLGQLSQRGFTLSDQ
jgi:hypothetical protein